MESNYLNIIFQTLNDSGLDYCIQNGYGAMPYSVPTDIDIFYRNSSERQLDEIVSRAAENAGLHVVQKVAMGYYHFVYWLTPPLPEPSFHLELDFQSELSLRSMPHYFIPNELMDRKKTFRNFYIPSPFDEIIYTILRRTVKRNFEEKHLDTIKRAFASDPQDIGERIRQTFDEDMASHILELIQSDDAECFDKHYSTFCQYVLHQSKQNNTLSKRSSQCWYNISRMLPLRFLNPTGMDIALLSPDGGGKTTILNALREYEVSSFSGIERKYVRPGLFQNIGQYKPNAKPEMTDNPNPHGRKPDGTIKSWIRFLIYLVDFTIGYYLKVVPLKWQRKLVVFDRYYYDYFVDMYRYHYSLPQWVPHFFSAIIPKPEITFILYASPEVLYQRKRELTLEETERQCAAFKDVATKVKGAVLIDVNRPIEDIIKEIVSHIINRRVELTKRKLK